MIDVLRLIHARPGKVTEGLIADQLCGGNVGQARGYVTIARQEGWVTRQGTHLELTPRGEAQVTRTVQPEEQGDPRRRFDEPLRTAPALPLAKPTPSTPPEESPVVPKTRSTSVPTPQLLTAIKDRGGRMTVAAMADRLGMTPDAVRVRCRKLERNGRLVAVGGKGADRLYALPEAAPVDTPPVRPPEPAQVAPAEVPEAAPVPALKVPALKVVEDLQRQLDEARRELSVVIRTLDHLEVPTEPVDNVAYRLGWLAAHVAQLRGRS